ncbi:hypothetical protein [Oleiharenicola lentus]|uniref:hypothetical protein n=1 Tax=Oleiharenicola lentus TaxID=2508720 RepID=UPI003F681989
MPFKFDSPEGRMEITVRPGVVVANKPPQFTAAATYLQPGARALERIPLSAHADSHTGTMQVLTSGFKVNLASHPKDSAAYRVLNALCSATGVTEVDN